MEWKLESFLQPDWVNGREVWCIGCGALGSRYVKRLVQAGVQRIHVVDDDTIEARNVANTEDFARFIGKKKVDAMMQVVREMRPGSDIIVPHYEKASESSVFSGLVLLGLDWNPTRRLIVENCLRAKPGVDFFVDGRMGASGGRAYGVDPTNMHHIETYLSEQHLPAPTEEQLGGCVQTPAAAPTADIVAGMTLWRLGRWLHLEQGCEDPYDNYVGFEMVPEFHAESQAW